MLSLSGQNEDGYYACADSDIFFFFTRCSHGLNSCNSEVTCDSYSIGFKDVTANYIHVALYFE